MLCKSSGSVCVYSCHTSPTLAATSCSPPQVDTSEMELLEEKATDHSYSQMEDDTFQASATALPGTVCGTDLEYLNSSTPKVSLDHSAPCWRTPVENKCNITFPIFALTLDDPSGFGARAPSFRGAVQPHRRIVAPPSFERSERSAEQF